MEVENVIDCLQGQLTIGNDVEVTTVTQKSQNAANRYPQKCSTWRLLPSGVFGHEPVKNVAPLRETRVNTVGNCQ